MSEQNEPLFMNLDTEALGYKQAVELAKKTLPMFKENLETLTNYDFACVKFFIPEEQGASFGGKYLVNETFF